MGAFSFPPLFEVILGNMRESTSPAGYKQELGTRDRAVDGVAESFFILIKPLGTHSPNMDNWITNEFSGSKNSACKCNEVNGLGVIFTCISLLQL